MVMVVYLANEMAHALKKARNDDERLQAIPPTSWQHLHLTEDEVCAAFTQADEALTLVGDVLP